MRVTNQSVFKQNDSPQKNSPLMFSPLIKKIESSSQVIPPGSSFMITEDLGDFMITEDGDFMITE